MTIENRMQKKKVLSKNCRRTSMCIESQSLYGTTENSPIQKRKIQKMLFNECTTHFD